ncbi:putative glutamine amidotransferase [Mycobacterium sp. BK558]|nr:putative glutamine amidotransferase [Mycobacterium sp. BK558]
MSQPRQPVVAVTMDFDVLRRYHHWRAMLAGIVAAGAAPLTIDCRHPRADLERLVSMADGLILLGGSDVRPELYGGDAADPLIEAGPRSLDDNEITALNVALRESIPVLAICRGAQLTNVALGGTLFADLARDRPSPVRHRFPEEELDLPAHTVQVEAGTRLAEWVGTSGAIKVNSQHHQGIKTLAPNVRATAVAEDGLVEAFEIAAADLVAVQWHPEILWLNDTRSQNLMRNFVNCCADRSVVATACC